MIWNILHWAIQLYLGALLIKLMLRVVRNEQLSFESWKQYVILSTDDLKKYFFVSVIYSLIVLGGLILLVVPGIIWGLSYSQAIYLVVDKGLGVRESLTQSKHLMQGNRLQFLGMGFILIGINIIGALLFGLGLLITIPATALAGVITYRQVIGEDMFTTESQPAKVTPESSITPPTPLKSPATTMNDYQI